MITSRLITIGLLLGTHGICAMCGAFQEPQNTPAPFDQEVCVGEVRQEGSRQRAFVIYNDSEPNFGWVSIIVKHFPEKRKQIDPPKLFLKKVLHPRRKVADVDLGHVRKMHHKLKRSDQELANQLDVESLVSRLASMRVRRPTLPELFAQVDTVG